MVLYNPAVPVAITRVTNHSHSLEQSLGYFIERVGREGKATRTTLRSEFKVLIIKPMSILQISDPHCSNEIYYKTVTICH